MSSHVGITVWFGGREKHLAGVTRHTTCDEIVYALLKRENKEHRIEFNPNTYALFEQWRDVEKHLPGRSKLLRIWKAWGVEQKNVRFILKKLSSTTYTRSRSKMKFRKSKKRSRNGKSSEDSDPEKNSLLEKCVVKSSRTDKSSRNKTTRKERSVTWEDSPKNSEKPTCDKKLNSMNKPSRVKRQSSVEVLPGKRPSDEKTANNRRSSSESRLDIEVRKTDISKVRGKGDNDKSARRLEHFVQCIIAQDQKIREQQSRLHELDVQIELYETRTHHCRMQQDGKNYLQDTYLSDFTDDSDDSAVCNMTSSELRDYVQMCEGLIEINKRIVECEESVHDISTQILDETTNLDEAAPHSNESIIDREFNTIQEQIQKSVDLRLEQELLSEEMASQIKQHECELRQKEQFFEYLMSHLSVLEPIEELGESGCEEGQVDVVDVSACVRNDDNDSACENDDDLDCGVYHVSQYHRESSSDGDSSVDDNDNQQQISLWCKPITSTSRMVHKYMPHSENGAVTPNCATNSNNYEAIYDVSPIEKRVSFSDELEICDSTSYGAQFAKSRVMSDNDSNSSDTGLSSLHSSEEMAYVLETLV